MSVKLMTQGEDLKEKKNKINLMMIYFKNSLAL